MRVVLLSISALSALATAKSPAMGDYTSVLPSRESPSPHQTSQNSATTPTQPLSASSATSVGYMSEFDMLPHALKQFIFDMSPKPNLEERQNAAPGGGAAPAAAQPTQLSPTTVYDIGKGATTYVQSFASTPEPFPQPTPGSIGLGQIQGQVGTMRTYDNPAPTNCVDSRVVFAVAGGLGAGMLL